MTMALAPPSEEERRLLREYRLTTIPSRRSSCSPATSNASSSTTATINTFSDLQQPQIIKTTNKATTPKQQGSISSNNQSQTSPNTQNSTTNTQPQQQQKEPQLQQPQNQQHQHQQQQQQQHHHHHHHHKHQNSHHHHSSNHRRHKNAAPTHELTADDLNCMLKLAEDLEKKLNLVSPNGIDDTNGNGIVMKQTHNTGEAVDQPDRSPGVQDNSAVNGAGKINVNNSSPLTSNGINSVTTSSCKPYIFEKVDYIKKINIRRKAFKKLKKARAKSRVISPTATESRRIKM